jgi:erythrin-vacuolar iron transport family protein
MMKTFADLSEQQIMALAISSEDDCAKTYAGYAAALMADYPASAKVFVEMAEEEHDHRRSLTSLYREKYGDHLPLIERSDVKGFVKLKQASALEKLSIDTMRKHAEVVELENYRFYVQAAASAKDPQIKKLLTDLAEAEKGHESLAMKLGMAHLTADAKISEHETQARKFLLQIVQPGLVGLMDGSVSTLAPIFAAAFATGSTWQTFLVGTAASVGAGISMGLAEGLSDDGKLTGRGHPLIRGLAAGIMTAVGGLGHTLPFLITDFHTAFVLAVIVVLVELAAISWFITGILIGSA